MYEDDQMMTHPSHSTANHYYYYVLHDPSQQDVNVIIYVQ